MIDPLPLVGGARPDGRPRWRRSLSHAGPLLPAPYAPLPPSARPRWRGRPVKLPPAVEEAIVEYVRAGGTVGPGGPGAARLLGSASAAGNFWRDVRSMLPPRGGCPITSLDGSKLDLSPVASFVRSARVRPTGQPVETKKNVEAHAVALVDGKPQPISPFAVDRPGVFRGRDSALTGRYRRRITAADVTLNLSRGVRPPPCGPPGGCRWGAVVSDPRVDWVARWRDPLTRGVKYARFAAASVGEQTADRAKYELARRADARLPAFRRKVLDMLRGGRDQPQQQQQLGAALWLVDRLALRVGSGGVAAALRSGVYGASTLLQSHVTSASPSSLLIDFVGKDSVRFTRTVVASSPYDRAAIAVLRTQQRTQQRSTTQKQPPDALLLLPHATAARINAAVEALLGTPGASSKTLRTRNASATFEATLRSLWPSSRRPSSRRPSSGENGERRTMVNLALLIARVRVAILCNHRRGGGGKKTTPSSTRGGPASDEPDGVDLARLDATLDALQRRAAAALAAADAGAARRIAKAVRDDVVNAAVPPLSLATARANYVDPRIPADFLLRSGSGVSPDRAFTPALRTRFGWAVREVERASSPFRFRYRQTPRS